MSVEAHQRVDALMNAYQGTVPGASLSILQNGAPVFRRAYGLSDLERQVAATTATNYRLASLSKQFTAAAILLLVEEGRLALDEGVRTWLPTLPDAAAGITLRHLLTHTSGLLDYEDLIPAQRSSQLHDADVLELLASERSDVFRSRERATATATADMHCWRSPPRPPREWTLPHCCAGASSNRWACTIRRASRMAFRPFPSRVRL